MKRIVIIGGGAAGLMAAVAAASPSITRRAPLSGAKEEDPHCEITLFEKNPYLGAKVIISGGGRCNVTTGIFDVKELLKNYPRGAKFIMSAMFCFPPEKVMAWFENHGVPLKMEEDLRVFPVSDNGKDIVGALEKELRQKGVLIFCNASVTNVKKQGMEFIVTTKDSRHITFDAVILTTGGSAYRHTGSTGDGYAFASALGHTITPLGPSLNSFVIREKLSSLAGVSFEHAKLTLGPGEGLEGGERKYEYSGAFMFTHRGVSGPAVFALSSYAAYEPISLQTPLRLTVDFFPDEKPDAFPRRLFSLIQKNARKSLANFLDILLPKSLCAVVASLYNIEDPVRNKGRVKAGALTKQNCEILARLLKEFPITVIGRSAGEEFVTAGGIDTAEMNTNTMESKICPGLYGAGEILDVDGFTGGFNLQASWATGALAGAAAASCRS